jgi:hypothetical protein
LLYTGRTAGKEIQESDSDFQEIKDIVATTFDVVVTEF